MTLLAHFTRGAIDSFVALDKIARARVRVLSAESPDGAPRCFYGFGLEQETPHGVYDRDYLFETRDARQAAILALCDASEREGFPLTIS